MPDGRFAVVFFEVCEIGGHYKAKAVFWKALDEQTIPKTEVVALPAYFERQAITPVLSPFFAEAEKLLKDLAFIVSQPTRAPAF